MPFQIKQSDTAPKLNFQLLSADGVTPQNLTGATVKFSMKPSNNNSAAINKATCTITDAPNGIGYYPWIAADTAAAGSFDGEFEVTFADGSVMTFPNDSNIAITITPQIA